MIPPLYVKALSAEMSAKTYHSSLYQFPLRNGMGEESSSSKASKVTARCVQTESKTNCAELSHEY